MNFKEILNKLLHKNQAFIAMQADQQQKVVTSADADTDADDTSDLDTLLLEKELQFYQQTSHIRLALAKKYLEEAERCAKSHDQLGYKFATERVWEFACFAKRLEQIWTHIRCRIINGADQDLYQDVIHALENLQTIIEKGNKALAAIENLWGRYNQRNTPTLEHTQQRTVQEPVKTVTLEREDDDWELEL